MSAARRVYKSYYGKNIIFNKYHCYGEDTLTVQVNESGDLIMSRKDLVDLRDFLIEIVGLPEGVEKPEPPRTPLDDYRDLPVGTVFNITDSAGLLEFEGRIKVNDEKYVTPDAHPNSAAWLVRAKSITVVS